MGEMMVNCLALFYTLRVSAWDAVSSSFRKQGKNEGRS